LVNCIFTKSLIHSTNKFECLPFSDRVFSLECLARILIEHYVAYTMLRKELSCELASFIADLD
jgi:hypothetical protein